MGNHFLKDALDSFEFTAHFAYQHRALYDGNAKRRQAFLLSALAEMTFGFLLSEECGQSLRQSLEDQAEDFADRVIFVRELVADDASGQPRSALNALRNVTCSAGERRKSLHEASFGCTRELPASISAK